MAKSATATTCPYCGVGCGILAEAAADGRVTIRGDESHPANFGRLCSKGSALGATLSLDNRLLQPRIAGKRVDWSTALDQVAQGLTDTIAEYGVDAVAFYVSGQLLTEDYYVMNKLAKGFIGTANIDTNSRLCMASSVAGQKRTFGSDTVPGCYEDLEEADLVVLVGSNLAWCHPVLFQRLDAARKKHGTQVIVIDPRKTPTAEAADMHLAVSPGSDVALFNGLLSYLAGRRAGNYRFIDQYTEGVVQAVDAAKSESISDVAKETGVPPVKLLQFYEAYEKTERTVTVYSQGVNQSVTGTDKVNSIINCHLFTGRIGGRGMGPFSITGQPNAMGGREVGGLSNQLAAHMDLENPVHRALVTKFWNSPRIAEGPGRKAVDLFRAVRSGEIRAVWIMATNPTVSLPETEDVVSGLKGCPLVVVSDVTDSTRTARLADILLPAAAWGEKDGTVTNSERRISRQRAFLPVPGDAKPDWWMVSQVAQRMGYCGFEYQSSAEIFREHAALSAFENGGIRDFDIGGLSELSDQEYSELEPVQWPVPRDKPGGTARMFGQSRYFTSTGKAQFVPTKCRPAASSVSSEFPLKLNTGRIRDQWHTMTRTGLSASLSAHLAEPFVEMHPDDAAAVGLKAADLATIESDRGGIVVRALVTDRQLRGSVFVPMHWTEPYASCAHVGSLISGHVDPVSGQPELKLTPVRVRPFKAVWQGFVVSVRKPNLEGMSYWALARTAKGWRAEIAGAEEPREFSELAHDLMGGSGEFLAYSDASHGTHRIGLIRWGRLEGALIMARGPVEAARAWLADQLGRTLSAEERLTLLAGRSGKNRPDPGATVCSCFQIGVNQISAAASSGADSVEAVGVLLKAGTNCGSCRMEIARIIEANYVEQAV